jgi:hypothetical protein
MKQSVVRGRTALPIGHENFKADAVLVQNLLFSVSKFLTE